MPQKPIPPSPARRSRIQECVSSPTFAIVLGLVIVAVASARLIWAVVR